MFTIRFVSFIFFIALFIIIEGRQNYTSSNNYTWPWSTKECHPKDEKRKAIIDQYIKDNKLTVEDANLVRFIAGSCSPIVILPGLYSTKMQLQITNCTELQQYHPNIASACGYDKKCNEGFETTYWLNELVESHDESTCMAEIGKINYVPNPNKTSVNDSFIEEEFKGFILTYYGNTPQTNKDKECGFGASTNLLSSYLSCFDKQLRCLLDLKNYFINLGYELGINLFSVPLDWRRLTNDEYNIKLIKDTVDLAYKLNNKPVALIAHSFGSLMGLNYLYEISQEEKDKKVDRFITMGPPFLGANKVVEALTLGVQDFNVKVDVVVNIIDLFVSMQNQKILLNGILPSSLELAPKEFWKIHQDKPWMKTILKRVNVENIISKCVLEKFNSLRFLEDAHDDAILHECIQPNLDLYKEDLLEFKTLFPIFPDLINGCSKSSLSDVTCSNDKNCKNSIWDNYCRVKFFIPLLEPLFKISKTDLQEEYNLLDMNNIKELIIKYGISDLNTDLFDYLTSKLNYKLHSLEHPNVPVTVIFNNDFKSAISYKLTENPKDITSQNKYVYDVLEKSNVMTYGGGDNTVPSASAILPPLLWSLESNEKRKSIHLVQYCGNKNFPQEPFDQSKSQYRIIGCRCSKASSNACIHSSFTGDINILNNIKEYTLNAQNEIPLDNLSYAIDLVSRNITDVAKNWNCINLK